MSHGRVRSFSYKKCERPERPRDWGAPDFLSFNVTQYRNFFENEDIPPGDAADSATKMERCAWIPTLNFNQKQRPMMYWSHGGEARSQSQLPERQTWRGHSTTPMMESQRITNHWNPCPPCQPFRKQRCRHCQQWLTDEAVACGVELALISLSISVALLENQSKMFEKPMNLRQSSKVLIDRIESRLSRMMST